MPMMQAYFWSDLLREYLHDPPDKPLDIRGHESRGRRYAEIAAGRTFSSEEHSGAGAWADQRASEIERLPLPNAGTNYHRAIGPEDQTLTVSHPLWAASETPSPARRKLKLPELDESSVKNALHELTDSLDHPQARFLAVWRCLPAKLATLHPAYQYLPAETRVPDHTIWQHLDTTAGLYAAYQGNQKLAFVSLTIGPVQPFIAAARSVRDLWSGSMLLSWLSFQGMIPILERLGPTALVFPQLRGNPFMDLWMREQFSELHDLIPLPSADSRKSPCLPNRFVAMVPASEAETLLASCKMAVKKAWREISHTVHHMISPKLREISNDWDRHWQHQVDDYFEIAGQSLVWVDYDDDSLARLYGGEAFEEVFTEAGKLRELTTQMPVGDRPRYQQDTVGRWQARIELLGRMLESQKLVRKQPNYFPEGPTPPKCSLLGTYEQMGPAILAESSHFWTAASKAFEGCWTRLRKTERFSAIAFVKRFAPEAFFLQALQLQRTDLAIPDTATIAATHWLKKFKLDPSIIRQQHNGWSGQWLHAQSSQLREDENIPDDVWQRIRAACKEEKPPTYYSVLMIDGDHLGQWLQGKRSPSVQQAYHPEIVRYYRSINADGLLKTPRPVTPAYHGAISEALANFALHVVPQIVKEHQGVLIYAGGDDVLALFPTRSALACAEKLNLAFQGHPSINQGAEPGYFRLHDKDYLMMGPSATLSAGLAVVHYKEDLRHALELARQAEKFAKNQGRNALAITASRRSGETSTVLADWQELSWMQDWVNLFIRETKGQQRPAISNRWAYQLRETLAPLSELEILAPAQAEIKRQVSQMEAPERLYEWFLQSQKLSSELQLTIQQAQQQSLENGKRPAMGQLSGKAMAEWFGYFHDLRLQRLSTDAQNKNAGQLLKSTLPEFVLMCQTLAFLARGREE